MEWLTGSLPGAGTRGQRMVAVARKELKKDDLAPGSFLQRHRSLGPASARH